MKKVLRNNLLILIIPLFISACLSENQENKTILIMTYNTENLFDDIDNGSEYPEFDPENGKWTTEKFNKKLEKIAEVIKHINPDIAALQEIENENVLNTLCNNYLSGYNYRVMYPVKDSAVNCAIISKIEIENVNAFVPENLNTFRAILEISVNINGSVLHIFNNHWKSKLGGTEVTEKERIISGTMLIRRLKNIFSENPDADIIVLGDFNENVNEYTENNRNYTTALIPVSYIGEIDSDRSIFISGDMSNSPGTEVSEAVILYDPWFEYNLNETGSYCYKNRWQTPDHILLSPGLFNEKGFLYSKKGFTIINKQFLTDPETGQPLKENYSEYTYSDHLPVTISISYN